RPPRRGDRALPLHRVPARRTRRIPTPPGAAGRGPPNRRRAARTSDEARAGRRAEPRRTRAIPGGRVRAGRRARPRHSLTANGVAGARSCDGGPPPSGSGTGAPSSKEPPARPPCLWRSRLLPAIFSPSLAALGHRGEARFLAVLLRTQVGV